MSEQTIETLSQLKEELCGQHPEALAENAELVNFMAEACLRYRNFDVATASERLKNYIEWRRELFGNLAEQTLENDPTLVELIKTRFFQISPVKLANGATLGYLQLKYNDASKFKAQDVVRCWHYVVLSAIKREPELAQHGFVIINNMNGVGMYNIDLEIPKTIGSAVNKCMPLRLQGAIMYQPPFMLRFVIPVIKMILSEKMSGRLHVVTSEESLHQDHVGLENLASLPEEVGGTFCEYDPDSHLAFYQQHNTAL